MRQNERNYSKAKKNWGRGTAPSQAPPHWAGDTPPQTSPPRRLRRLDTRAFGVRRLAYPNSKTLCRLWSTLILTIDLSARNGDVSYAGKVEHFHQI